MKQMYSGKEKTKTNYFQFFNFLLESKKVTVRKMAVELGKKDARGISII